MLYTYVYIYILYIIYGLVLYVHNAHCIILSNSYVCIYYMIDLYVFMA